MSSHSKVHKEDWIRIKERPPWTGIYEVMFQKGNPSKRFYTGLAKPAYLPIGSKRCQEDVQQPTQWRFCDESYVKFFSNN